MSLEILKKSKKSLARIGKLRTAHGVINTPFFMPDATRGVIKGLSNSDLQSLDLQALVINTYHLDLQPGVKKIKQAGGMHKFMNWQKPLLSDSGGYQVYSLIHKSGKMGRITDKGAVFRSPFDGLWHKLTPEKSIQIQFDLGADMIVCLDDCPPHEISAKKMALSVARTIAWAQRCKAEYDGQVKKRKLGGKDRPLLFAVIQGGADLAMRKKCAEALVEMDFSGYGFGARPVDSEGRFLEKVLQYTADLIPENSLRFGLGIGLPEDIVRCVKLGWDMFDCVIPTREGRHGRLFLWHNVVIARTPLHAVGRGTKQSRGTSNVAESTGLSRRLPTLATLGRDPPRNDILKKNFYKTINITNSKFAKDFGVINENSKIPELREYSKAYLNHLFKTGEPLGARLASLNNLEFYLELMGQIREGILNYEV